MEQRCSRAHHVRPHAGSDLQGVVVTDVARSTCSCGQKRSPETDPAVAVFSSGFLTRGGGDPKVARQLGLDSHPPVQLRACCVCLTVYAAPGALPESFR